MYESETTLKHLNEILVSLGGNLEEERERYPRHMNPALGSNTCNGPISDVKAKSSHAIMCSAIVIYSNSLSFLFYGIL